MAEYLFPNWEVPVVGELQADEEAVPGQEKKPRKKGSKVEYTVKPKEFGGWYKNRVIFPPADPTASYFQEMDKFAKGIQSKETTMRNMGITNIYDEQARIKAEREEEAEHANNMGLAQQGQFVSPAQREAMAAQDQAGLASMMEQIKGIRGAAPDAIEDRKRNRDQALATRKQTSDGTVKGPGDIPADLTRATATPGVEEPTNLADVMAALKRA